MFLLGSLIGIDTQITSMSFLYRNMGKTNFGLNVVAAILKFKMSAYNKLPNASGLVEGVQSREIVCGKLVIS